MEFKEIMLYQHKRNIYEKQEDPSDDGRKEGKGY